MKGTLCCSLRLSPVQCAIDAIETSKAEHSCSDFTDVSGHGARCCAVCERRGPSFSAQRLPRELAAASPPANLRRQASGARLVAGLEGFPKLC